jgi:AcrR family transcriptional regulator
MKRVSTKEAIVTTAIDLFNAKGSSAVSTNHIAEAMGISPGNLYYHFGNKEEIIRHIYQRMVVEMDSAWVTEDDSTSPVEKFFSAMTAVQGMMAGYRFFQKELSGLLLNDPELALIYKKHRRVRMREIGSFFEYLIESGVMRRPENPRTLPRLVRVGWMIGDYWFDFLEIEDEPLNDENIGEGVELIKELLRPYFNAAI